MKKIICFLMVVTIIFGSMGLFSYASESGKNYYYFDSVNGDDANSCYGGTGTDTEYKGENIIEKLFRTVRNFFETLRHEIAVIFD